jgi:NADPH-dependent 2,4-dienoyl-CoA reductase/sulfur reductase-like enzyme
VNLPISELHHRVFDVAVVGAGPAGLAAADILSGYDLETVVIDEQARAGGQILRQPPETFRVENWLPSALYRQTKHVLRSVGSRTNIGWLFSTTVLGLVRHSESRTGEGGSRYELWIQNEDSCAVINARVVLLAPGCYERPLAFPGWTMPGVMGVGAIQGFLKGQQFVPGNRFLLAGSHPLQLVVADQLIAAGGSVAGVVFTQRRRDAMSMMQSPLVMLRASRELLETAGIMWRLRRAGVPMRFGSSIVGVEGNEAVERAIVAPIAPDGTVDSGRARTIDCDRVGLCHGFAVSSELARQAGADVRYVPQSGGWLVDHDRWFQSSVDHLFVAGEVTGMAGANASLEKGRIAALGALLTLCKISERNAVRQASAARRRLERLQRFATELNRLSRPPAGLADSVMSEDTIICRCESVTLEDLCKALDEHKYIRSANAAKLATRAGMGMCQGRFCGDNVSKLLAQARGLAPSDVGTFHVQFPVKPLNLGLLRN